MGCGVAAEGQAADDDETAQGRFRAEVMGDAQGQGRRQNQRVEPVAGQTRIRADEFNTENSAGRAEPVTCFREVLAALNVHMDNDLRFQFSRT